MQFEGSLWLYVYASMKCVDSPEELLDTENLSDRRDLSYPHCYLSWDNVVENQKRMIDWSSWVI
jgi:hypothetical protein